jgi:hypothetical protein
MAGAAVAIFTEYSVLVKLLIPSQVSAIILHPSAVDDLTQASIPSIFKKRWETLQKFES